jgi:hypothetical protein
MEKVVAVVEMATAVYGRDAGSSVAFLRSG